MSEVEIRPLDVADDEALAAWHATYLVADTYGREHPTPWMLEEMRADLRGDRPAEKHLAFGGHVDGQVVSVGLVELPQKENRHIAWTSVWTHPEHRRRGYGSVLLEHAADLARAEGRTTLSTEAATPYDGPADGSGHPDADFLTRRGFTVDIGDVKRVLDLPVDAALLDRLAGEAAPHHDRYTLRQFAGPVPQDIIEPFGALIGSLMVEAPMGEVAREFEVMDEERIRADERVFAESGRTKYTTVAIAPNGDVAAYSELVVPRHDPGRVYQGGTLVMPEHRGHRLGLATKVHNLRWMQAQEPGRELVITWNAEVNKHMIGVNEQLGFRPVERLVEFHRPLD
jgi:GNAT superfamily N-acetyltransferase